MAAADVSCVLVQLDEGFGIVTDSDLRRKLVAEDLPGSTPVGRLMIAPAKTFAPESLAVDAMIDMLDAGIHHLPIVDPAGTPLGVVTATDLMYLESRTPFALRRSIAHAASVDELVDAAGHLPQMIVSLIRAGVSPLDVGRVIALQSDTATTRLIELITAERGPAPVAWSWLALGSTARREATLASDQDNALAYADPGGPEVDAYFADVAGEVNVALAALRLRCRQRRGAGAKPRLAALAVGMGARVPRLPGEPRPQPSGARGRGLRLPRRGRRPRDRAARWSRSSGGRRTTPTSSAGWRERPPTSRRPRGSAAASRSVTTAAST